LYSFGVVDLFYEIRHSREGSPLRGLLRPHPDHEHCRPFCAQDFKPLCEEFPQAHLRLRATEHLCHGLLCHFFPITLSCANTFSTLAIACWSKRALLTKSGASASAPIIVSCHNRIGGLASVYWATP
ncbi:unnamed protein product, partial [Hapterophycus canaliculatus]